MARSWCYGRQSQDKADLTLPFPMRGSLLQADRWQSSLESGAPTVRRSMSAIALSQQADAPEEFGRELPILQDRRASPPLPRDPSARSYVAPDDSEAAVLSADYYTEAGFMPDGQPTLRPFPGESANPSCKAERCLLMPLSADNRMINVVVARSFAHELISAATGFAPGKYP